MVTPTWRGGEGRGGEEGGGRGGKGGKGRREREGGRAVTCSRSRYETLNSYEQIVDSGGRKVGREGGRKKVRKKRSVEPWHRTC